MPRNNYEKVDQAMEAGLLKMKAERWIKESEKVSEVKKSPENLRSTREKLAEVTEQRRKEHRLIAAAIQHDVDRLFLKDKHLYTALGTFHEEFIDLIAAAESMDESKWKRLMEIKESLEAYKKIHLHKPVSNESLVELERKKHINKRHNVKDNWLPLH